MNVHEFFNNASNAVARNDAAALVIGRFGIVGLTICAIIGLIMLIIWLAQQCLPARPMNFEHFEDGDWDNKTFVPFLQEKLKSLNTLKKDLDSVANNVENAQDNLEGAKEDICTVTEEIHDNYVNARMSGVDPTIANEDKATQDKKLASRQARAEHGWKRKQANFSKTHGRSLVECFDDKVDTSSKASILAQISTTCDDMNDKIEDIKELGQSKEFQETITMFISITGSIEFTKPFLLNNATITGNNLSNIRDMPKPDVTATTDVSGAKATEGFADADPQKFFAMTYPDISNKYDATVSAATNMVSAAGNFLEAVKHIKGDAKDALTLSKKIKQTTQDLKDGKVTPAYLDEKPT